ncbi:MAG: hypothetical protein ACE5HI_04215 [bacterium]
MPSRFENWFEKAKQNAYVFNEQDGIVEFYLHILIDKEHDLFTAHCLEFDLVADGSTIEQVQKDIMDVCREHIVHCFDNKHLEYLLDFAPKEYWRQFYDCHKKKPKKPYQESYPSYPRFLKEVNFAQCPVYA